MCFPIVIFSTFRLRLLLKGLCGVSCLSLLSPPHCPHPVSLLPAQPQVREAPPAPTCTPRAVLLEPLSPARAVTEKSGSSCCELEPESRRLETWGLLAALPLNFCGSVGKSLTSPGFPHKFDRVPWDSPRKGTVQVQSLIMIVII